MTVDLHIDIPWRITKIGDIDLSINNHGDKTMTDFPRMKMGGLDCAVLALYLSDHLQDRDGEEASRQRINDQLDCLHFNNNPHPLALEGARLLFEDMASVEKYRDRGVKYLTLTHNFNNSCGDSSTDEDNHNGLSIFGAFVLEECERAGVIIDVSHSSDDTAYDVIRHSTKPVMATHSGCRSLVNHPRNLSDELIKEIANTGGLIGVPFVRKFIGEHIDDVAKHIDHIVTLVGPKHVAIGSDLDGAVMIPGIKDVTDWSRVVIGGLKKLGYSSSDIDDISGNNAAKLLL